MILKRISESGRVFCICALGTKGPPVSIHLFTQLIALVSAGLVEQGGVLLWFLKVSVCKLLVLSSALW